MPFITEAISRVGGREINEDSYGFLEMNRAACWVVADGLGGHRGGDTASRVAVDATLASFRSTPEFSAPALRRHLEAAQQAILKAQIDQPSLSTMRTTMVILLTDSERMLWAHVGDSRLYCLENGHIVAFTKDHSVVQAMVTAGELPASRIRHHEDRNRLLRCLGNAETDFRPTVLTEPRALSRSMAFLLCTDGFWENVTESEIEVDLAKGIGAKDWLALMEGRLLERATESNDNYTAIAIRFDSEGVAEAPGVASPVSANGKSRVVNRLRLMRIGLAGIGLIVLEILLLQTWEKQYELERRGQDLTGERNVLAKVAEIQKQILGDAQKQLYDCESRGPNRPGHNPAR